VTEVASVELAVLASVSTLPTGVTLMPEGRVPTPTMMVAVALSTAVDVTTTCTGAPTPVCVSQVRAGAEGVMVRVEVLACARPEQTVSASSAANARDAWVFKIDMSIWTILFIVQISPRRREEAAGFIPSL
jgi:hypothetical protein